MSTTTTELHQIEYLVEGDPDTGWLRWQGWANRRQVDGYRTAASARTAAARIATRRGLGGPLRLRLVAPDGTRTDV